MTYLAYAVYRLGGEFEGYVIKNDAALKLQSTNLYREGEEDQLREQLDRLNNQLNLNAHWPSPQDPDVQALVKDPNFHPIEYIEVDVVDDEASHYVYKQIAGGHDPNEASWRDQAWQDDPNDVDEEASTIVYKKARVPKNPTDEMQRIKAACEQVARARMG